MKPKDFISDFIEKKQLLNISHLLDDKRTSVITSEESIYNCLNSLEQDSSKFDYVIIDNEDFKSYLVLLNNSNPILCLGYDEDKNIEGVVPISVNCRKGINHQQFSYRYILFMSVDENLNVYQIASSPAEKSEDHKQLSRFLRSISGEEPKTDDLYQWWLNRY